MKAVRFVVVLALVTLHATALVAQDTELGPGAFLESLRQSGDESLLHAGSPFVDLKNYDGGEQSSVTTTRAWRQMLHELHDAAEQRSLSTFQVGARSEVPPIDAVDQVALSFGTEVVPIALMNYTYRLLREDAVEKGLVTLKGDRLVPSGAESPFIEKRVFSAAALRERTWNGSNTNFLLNSRQLFFANESLIPDYLEIDFDDGSGFRRVGLDDVINVSYSSTGEKLIKVRARYASGVLHTAFAFHVEAIAPPPPTKTETIGADLGYKDEFAQGRVYYWQQDPGRLANPIVVVEGFDVKEESEPTDWAQYYTMLDRANMVGALRERGYDIVFLDFDDSQDYIQRNAFLLIRLIHQLNEATQDPLVVVGPSMGGVVARYALSYMEYHGLQHNARLFISYDSPQQGANIPLGLQHWVDFFGDEEKGNNEEARYFGRVVNGPAARQLLVYHHLGYDGDGPPGPDSLRYELVAELAGYGDYPKALPKIAITNGSGYGGPQVLPLGERALEWSDRNGLLLYQEIIESHVWALPNTPIRTPVFTGVIAVRIRLPFRSVYLKNIRNEYYVEHARPFDSAPGGTRGSFKEVADVDTDGRGDIVAFHESHSWIPTVSALDIRVGDQPLVQPEVDLFYNIADDRSNVKTPFDDIFFQSTNEEHSWINENTAAWIIEWIERGRGDDTAPECGEVSRFRDDNPSSPDRGREVIQVTLSDPQSGLASVEFVELRNAYGRVGPVSPFLVSSISKYHEGDIQILDGQTSTTVRGVEIEPDKEFAMEILVTNRQGLTRTCESVRPALLVTALPGTFGLEQNYPNPFREQTTIRFALAEPVVVTLTVYDAVGRRVATLIDEEMAAGAYEAEWDGINDAGLPLASGLYVYRLEAGRFTETRTMTLVQ